MASSKGTAYISPAEWWGGEGGQGGLNFLFPISFSPGPCPFLSDSRLFVLNLYYKISWKDAIFGFFSQSTPP